MIGRVTMELPSINFPSGGNYVDNVKELVGSLFSESIIINWEEIGATRNGPHEQFGISCIFSFKSKPELKQPKIVKRIRTNQNRKT